MKNYVSPISKEIQLELKTSVLQIAASETSGSESGGRADDIDIIEN